MNTMMIIRELPRLSAVEAFMFSAILITSFCLILLSPIVLTFSLRKILLKANKHPWAGIIPLYNLYCLCRLLFDRGWLFILLFLFPINIYFYPYLVIQTYRKFGGKDGFIIGIATFFYFWFLMLVLSYINMFFS